jgi:hypothetical protein
MLHRETEFAFDVLALLDLKETRRSTRSRTTSEIDLFLFSWLEGRFGPLSRSQALNSLSNLRPSQMFESLVATVREQRQFGLCQNGHAVLPACGIEAIQ